MHHFRLNNGSDTSLIHQIFTYLLVLCLRTSRNKCFTSFVSFVFCKVLNKSLCQIFCFCFPLCCICICITRIKDCRIYSRKCCRYFKGEYRNSLCWSIVDVSVKDSINDSTSIFYRDTLSCSVPSCVYEISLSSALLHLLNKLFSIFCWMKFKECLSETS